MSETPCSCSSVGASAGGVVEEDVVGTSTSSWEECVPNMAYSPVVCDRLGWGFDVVVVEDPKFSSSAGVSGGLMWSSGLFGGSCMWTST